MPEILGLHDPGRFFGRALNALWAGRVVAIPTDTVYGLAASVERPEGVKRIFALKGRKPEKPLPLQFSSLDEALRWGFIFSDGALRAAKRFWPGPLTLVMDRPRTIPEWFAPDFQEIAVRIPSNLVTVTLLTAFKGPVAVTSANRSGEAPALDADGVAAAFPDAADLVVLNGGPAPGGRASSVVDATGHAPLLLREGPVAFSEVEAEWFGDGGPAGLSGSGA